ncbi:hypothetical protein IDJ81_06215 [Tsuneonella flava]|uniref:Lipoprotein n=1 Tax=Tsuneonella flava TaxID=2055955 RepID=A0ABX7KDX8_9SPHN|nr:hypothetical protein [Tsuneonella flava]QSB45697.1 hypothetical protein IDJ81_06215 [Tsuneonella flava]
MFNRYQNVFRSRWRALLWAGGVLLTAYCSVPSRDDTAQQHPTVQAAHEHYNPWAVDKPAQH